MKIQKKQAIGENLLYLMVWSAIILVPVLNSLMMAELHVSFENVLIAWRQISPYLLIFFVHNTILAPRYMLRHKYWKYIAGNLLLILGIFTPVYFFTDLPEAALLPENELHGVSFSNLKMYWNVVLALFMNGANSAIKLMYQSIRDEQHMEALKQQNLQAEMDYLKYQINPHFFMNTLNNIHALIDIDKEKAQKTVLELSKIMRYVLYDASQPSVPLEKEIHFLSNYIELMKIRYTEQVDIRVSLPGEIPHTQVPPLLFISFLENAFKHGISYKNESFIHLSMETRERELHCLIVNSNFNSKKTGETGIGLENTRKRLRLLYDTNYTLHIENKDDQYRVLLIIPIQL